MQKEFDRWNILKKKIHDKSPDKIFAEREVWWCQLGLNIGDEEDGKNSYFERPVLVIRKFNKNIAVIVPLTTKGKIGSIFYHQLTHRMNSFVILSQIRVVSSKRFLRKMFKLGRSEFCEIKNKSTNLI